MLARTVFAQDTLPRPTRFVNNYSQLLTPPQLEELEGICQKINSSKGVNALVLLIDSISDTMVVTNYAKRLFKQWDLNNAGKGYNYILLYHKKSRAIRIEYSDGLKTILGRDYVAEVISISMKPLFKNKKDYEALKRGVEMLNKKIEANLN